MRFLVKIKRKIRKGEIYSVYIGLMILLGLSLLSDLSRMAANNEFSEFSTRDYAELEDPIDEEKLESKMADKKEMSVKNNYCPDMYTLPEDLESRFSYLEQISNHSISKNPNKIYDKTIVILSPISNSVKDLLQFFQTVCSLSYPHELISVVLGEDSSKDNTYKEAKAHARMLAPYFKSIQVHHFKDNLKVPRWVRHRHNKEFQFQRRAHMAKARNQLLFYGLKDEDFVLWIDNDVKYVPHDIIQHLLSENKDIIVPSCMQAVGKILRRYDSNTWKETNESLSMIAEMGRDELKFEGYEYQTQRKFLDDLMNEGRVVKLDSVGGCVLMVKADCHRKGLIFPPFPFDHHIETEGLGKMATRMGFGIYGLPHVTVIHNFISSKSFLPVIS